MDLDLAVWLRGEGVAGGVGVIGFCSSQSVRFSRSVFLKPE